MNRNNVSFKEQCFEFISENGMFEKGDTVVVGVSGGADSVCLLSVLNSLKNELGISLIAVHINHGIRGAEADRDENFVKEFCEKLNVEFRAFHFDCPEESKKTGESLEECGRRLRYEAFNSVCKDNSFKIATAHNANDNAETVLFNISRGASLKGASGIPVKRENIIRPVLFASRNSIEEYCTFSNLSFVTDSTNNCDDYSRNKIRHETLPSLINVNCNAVESIFRFTQYVSDDVKYLENVVNDKLKECSLGDNKYSVSKLLSYEKPILIRCIVKSALLFSGETLDNAKIKQILSLLHTGGKCQLYKNCFAEVKNNELTYFDFLPVEKTISQCVNISPEQKEYELGKFKIIFEKSSKKVNENLLDNLIDYDKIQGILVLRTRIPGDDFLLPKRNVKKSLKKLFNELKIPVELRNSLPVIADDNGIVWVYSVGVSKQYLPAGNSANIYSVRGEIYDR